MARVSEKFMVGPVVSSRDRYHITRNSKGVFTFNRKLFEDMGKPKAVVFYFERSTNVIGIQKAHPILQEAFPVKAKADRYYQTRYWQFPFAGLYGYS